MIFGRMLSIPPRALVRGEGKETPMDMTDRYGDTSNQAETCWMCGGGVIQRQAGGRVVLAGSTFDLWLCRGCVTEQTEVAKAHEEMISL